MQTNGRDFPCPPPACAATLTVFFEPPYWVGVYERREGGLLTVCKMVFGAEPKDYEVYQHLLDNWAALRFSPPVADGDARPAPRQRNPKRLQREIGRQLDGGGIGTKAQQAMQLQHAEGKAARRQATRQQREAEAAQRFARKQAQRKEKHKGH